MEILKNQAKAAGLSRSETVMGVIIDDSDWMTNGFMTSSSKVKRREVRKTHDKQIEELWKKF